MPRWQSRCISAADFMNGKTPTIKCAASDATNATGAIPLPMIPSVLTTVFSMWMIRAARCIIAISQKLAASAIKMWSKPSCKASIIKN